MDEKYAVASIILCAGKGRRMKAPRTPKVCFSVAGKPVIIHMLDRLAGLGFFPNVLVVGHLAGQVVDEVGPKHPEALFVYQQKLLGTGNAAKCGTALLQGLGFDGAILVVAGDKTIEPRALEKLLAVFRRESADMALIVAPKARWPNAGRIVTQPDGRVVRCIEKADLRHAEAQAGTFSLFGKMLTAAQVEASVKWVNQAVYLYRAEALYEALGALGRDNVQGEEYVTDTIGILVERGKKVIAVPVDDPNDVLAFNSPEELLEIEEHFRRKAGVEVIAEAPRDPRVFKSPRVWADRLANPDHGVRAMLSGIYGNRPALCEQKRAKLLRAVEQFMEAYDTGRTEGTEPVVIIRAPGRINLMGRHVDHRGGCVNLMAIDNEQVLVARGRKDTVVRARNADADRFEDLEFAVGDLLRQVQLDDWRDFINSEAVIRMVRDLQGNWGNYIKAPMLRLQQEFRDRLIHGMDCLVHGDIPMAAGLSSSSALVVAAAEAFVLVNGLDVSPPDLVDVCGEGEWFVGTRGGSADHAAVKLSQSGRIAHVGFFPFAIKEYVPFPQGYCLVICNSRIQARKAAGARDTFNERVASYEFGVHLVRQRFPNHAPLIHHLRDISPSGLGIRSADVYRILLDIPETMTPAELEAELGSDECRGLFATHRLPERYPLRACLLFGIAECARSTFCVKLLRSGAMERFGWLMNVSHDGDRVAAPDGSAYVVDVSDRMIRTQIENLQSEDPDRVLAGQLYAQPGGYACSIPQIDHMVDIALATPGVLGAQLSGAGLGGCMMVLAREDAAEDVIGRMNELYYAPSQLEPGAAVVTPIAGCGPLTLVD